MSLKINIDASSMAAAFKEFAREAEREITQAVQGLATMTHAKVAENAAATLKSSAKLFKDNLGFEEVTPGIWVVSIGEPAMWIEEGIPHGHDMKPDLLKNGTPGANGGTSRVIKFDHKAPPKSRNATADRIIGELKVGLRKINREAKKMDPNVQAISLKGIEKNPDGSPRIGKLHEFDLQSDLPTKTAQHPALKGLTIYQSKDESGNVRRDVLTFRTVSSKSDPDSWIHPGYTGNKFLDEAEEWAWNEWETKILPELMTNLNGSYK